METNGMRKTVMKRKNPIAIKTQRIMETNGMKKMKQTQIAMGMWEIMKI